ncbi:MAG: SUMF1/EgtB/PvdO family nonheme iron enzyme [Nitrospinae bacterium]|nr:SUMF1/EgtB/PvdO family nonheme iron enzyme [Nitrospinota bacterium]
MKILKFTIGLILPFAIFNIQSAISLEPPFPPDGMALVPAGEFIMGSNRNEIEKAVKDAGGKKEWFFDEEPKRKVNIPSFYIDIYEVTNEDYKKFDPNHSFPSDRAKHPVVNITWNKANDYCKWAGKSLPTEEEWEKAARGTDERIYPWGNEFDKHLNNSYESGLGGGTRVGQFALETSGAAGFGGTTEVGTYKDGKSPYGVYDMAGNVWEWTDNWYNKERNLKVIKGGSWQSPSISTRSAARLGENPNMESNDYGFRCAKDYKN